MKEIALSSLFYNEIIYEIIEIAPNNMRERYKNIYEKNWIIYWYFKCICIFSYAIFILKV